LQRWLAERMPLSRLEKHRRKIGIRRRDGLTLRACLAEAKIVFDRTGLITDNVDHLQ
jgi:hypothetical protein